MNKKLSKLYGVSPEPLLQADGHLSDGWLLLAIDGELPASDHAVLKNHVHACWKCRARKEHLEKTIKEIVEYDQNLVAPDMPPGPSGRAFFMARLHKLSAELGHPSLLHRWGAALSQSFRLALPSRVTWAAAATLAMGAVFYVVLQRNTPVVAASELLQRAAASESRSFHGVDQPVVVQKLSIKVNGRKVTRTIYRDTVRKRQAHRADVSATEEKAVEQNFQQSSFSWEDPLSPGTYAHWRDGVSEKQDAVTRLSGDLLKLDTSAHLGPIAEASLTVRANDYHPVSEDLRLRDNTQIEIAELSYEVVGMSTIDTDIFGSTAHLEPLRLPAASANLPIQAALPDAAQLAVSELQVRSVLHSIGADLGEQIDVQPPKNGSVLVQGVAVNIARRQQLLAALQSIPLTQLHIETVAQAAARQQTSRVSTGPVRVPVVASATPLLQASLKQRFPDEDQRTSYVNQTLALAQEASARAWALNRLAERYGPPQVELLDTSSRQRLGALLGDHLAALREDVNRLQNQLGQVLSSASNTAAANTASSGLPSLKTVDRGDDWREHAQRVHSSIETVNESVAALLTGSAIDENDRPETIELGLRTTLTQLQAELQTLDQQIRKQF